MNIKIISAIYFDLYGTSLGGRTGRNDHYLYSMNSIMNIDNAKFTIYTNNKTKLDTFFQENYPDKISKYSSIEYDLYNTEYKDKINRIKNIEAAKKSDRCIELQYSKLSWVAQNNYDCDYIYWIDAGLCYSGLLPNKYLKVGNGYNDSYYGSNIFNSNWINSITNSVKNKILVCAKDNVRNYWDSPVPPQYFTNSPDSCYHIIGGLFGGNTIAMNKLCLSFQDLANRLLDNEYYLYSEEQILSCLFVNYPDLFSPETFDIWWHEDNVAGNIGHSAGLELLENNKSFYKIIEKFI